MKMCDLSNSAIYLSKMRQTFFDKSWFMSIIPSDVTTIVDFGCADNSFCEFLQSNFPNYDYIGIENNQDFVKIIKKKNQLCFTSLSELAKQDLINPETTLLVLNSVIHEVYSYWDIDLFWQEVQKLNPKYIAFRDMYIRNCGEYGSGIERDFENAIKNNFMEEQYKSFIKEWGPLIDGYTAGHFLLKYFYKENWDRELKENYIPYHYRELHTKIRKAGYNITFERFYGLPYLKNKWKNDFNCINHPQLRDFVNNITTHLKLFLVKESSKL